MIVTSPLSKLITPPSARNKSDHCKLPFPNDAPSLVIGDKVFSVNSTSLTLLTLNIILLSVVAKSIKFYDGLGEVAVDGSSPTGVTPVSLVAPDTNGSHIDLIAEHVTRWYANLDERDQEIWTLYKSSYYNLRGVRGIELALSRKPGTDSPLASKSTIARRIKAMEEDLRSVLDGLLFAA